MVGTVPGLTLRQFLMVCALALSGLAVLGGGLSVLDRAPGAARANGAVAVKSAPQAVPEEDDPAAITPIPVPTQSIRFDAPAAAPEVTRPDAGRRSAATLPSAVRSGGPDRTVTASIDATPPQMRPEPVQTQDRPRAWARSRGKSADGPRYGDRRGRQSRRHVIAPAPVDAVRAGRGAELASASRSTPSAVCWQLKSGGGRCVDRDLATSRATR